MAEKPLWLMRREEFDEYIELLQTLKKSVFSLRISPVNVTTNIVIEQLLRLSKSYEDGVPKTERVNPTVKFDYRFSDSIGNPKQSTFYEKSAEAWNPQLAKFIRELTIFFSRSLKEDFTFEKDFHGLFKNLQEFLPPGFRSQKSKNAEKRKKNVKEIRAKKAQIAYYRRRQRK